LDLYEREYREEIARYTEIARHTLRGSTGRKYQSTYCEGVKVADTSVVIEREYREEIAGYLL
jgi:hypothetical protein